MKYAIVAAPSAIDVDGAALEIYAVALEDGIPPFGALWIDAINCLAVFKKGCATFVERSAIALEIYSLTNTA
ncbi:MAG: hypothetical protein EOS18_34190 [Mesorhizobium sp.]|nr:MAG: hypothetical protein EOS18_34190 [Mesorhizobium sp.]